MNNANDEECLDLDQERFETSDQEQFEGGDGEKEPAAASVPQQRKSVNSNSKSKNSDELQKLAKAEKHEKTVKFDDNEDENYEEEQIEQYEELTEEQKLKLEDDNQKFQEEVDADFSKRYDDKELYRIFALVFCASTLVNVDHGSIPGCAQDIMKKFHADNFMFGALGTAVYAGLTVGSAIGTKAYQNSRNIQQILSGSLILNAICLVLFTFTNNYKFNLFLRFLTGIFQVFISIFTPVWADAFGSDKLKSMWITILLVCSPVGIFIGFTLTSILNNYAKWEFSFYIQAISVVPVAIAIYYQDKKYLNVDEAVAYRLKCTDRLQAKRDKENEAKGNEEQAKIDNDPVLKAQQQEQLMKKKEENHITWLKKNRDLQEFLEIRSKISLADPRVKKNQQSERGSIRDMGYQHGKGQFSRGARSIISGQRSALGKSQKSKSERQSVGKDDNRTITYTEDDKSIQLSEKENLSFIQVVKTLCANTEFLLLMLAATGFYYVVAGVQYWCPNYLELIMGVNTTEATIYFSITTFCAPTSGVIVGGIVTSYYGGYSKRKVKEIVILVGWICVCVTAPIPFVDSFFMFGCLLWLMLFLGGFILPAMIGIMLTSVKQHQRGSANSIAQLSNNMLGFMPAPAIYGALQDVLNKDPSRPKSRIPMAFLLYSVFFTLTCCTIAILRQINVEHQASSLSQLEKKFQNEQEDDEERVSLIEDDSKKQEVTQEDDKNK